MGIKRVLNDITAIEQLACVRAHLISNNAIIERFHAIKSKTQGKVGNVVMKLDTSKVCDRVVVVKMAF